MTGIADRKARGLIGVALLLALAGCQVVPGAGPLAGEVQANAGKSAKQQNRKSALVYDVVDVDAGTARIMTDYQVGTLKRKFGYGGGSGAVLIGVGDQLVVTIFEAGVDGLFSTTDSKQSAITVIVQPDGMAAIPYVGQVRFAGRTLEQARQTILGALKGKAVEPDVIVTPVNTASRTVTVSGAVRASGLIPLGLKGDRIAEVIAKAGGPANQPYETYVTLNRGRKVATVLYKYVVENPSENIYVSPDDQIFVTYDPRTFSVIGETLANNRIPFGSNELNLIEALAMAGGGRDTSIDATGVFLFRYEDRDLVERLLGPERFQELLSKGMMPDKWDRFPIVYRINLRASDGMLVAQTFPMKNRDVLYASRHPTVDILKFFDLIERVAVVTDYAQVIGGR